MRGEGFSTREGQTFAGAARPGDFQAASVSRKTRALICERGAWICVVASALILFGLPGHSPAQSSSAPASRGATDGLGDAIGTGLDYFYHKKPTNGSAAQGLFDAKDVAKRRVQASEAVGERFPDPAARAQFIQFLGETPMSGGSFGSDPTLRRREAELSPEASREIVTGVQVFRDKIKSGEVAAASDRLKQAFAISPYHPSLLALPLQEKQRIEQYVRTQSAAANMVEARDYGSLEETLGRLRTMAPDFDDTKARALLTSVHLQCRMLLSQAKLSQQKGDEQGSLQNLEEAREIWPGNPELAEMSGQVFQAADAGVQQREDFDRRVAAGEYRAIFDQQLQFAPAFANDPERMKKLKEIVARITAIDQAVMSAGILQQQGQVNAAWEVADLAIKDYPEDSKLNTLWRELSGPAAEFISALDKARSSEAKGDLGFSLTWYARAQYAFPNSVNAKQGLARLIPRVLESSVAPVPSQ